MTSSDRPAADPRSAYEERLTAHRARAAVLERERTRLGWGRVAVAIVGTALVGVALLGFLSPWWLMIPVLGLIGLSVPFGRAGGQLAVAKRSAAFHERGLVRVNESWHGKGEAGTAFLDENHLYAADLDIFGAGSLFERLCEARTRIGQETLAAWLRAPTDPETIRERQSAVADLRPRLELREQLAGLGALVPAGIDTPSLIKWATTPPALPHRAGKPLLHALTLALGVTLLLWAADLTNFVPVGVVLAFQTAFVAWHLGRTARVLTGIERRAADLSELSGILARIESESFQSPHLVRLQQSLRAAGESPSRQLQRLANLIDLLNARRNQFFFPFALALMWGTRMSYSIEAWRLRCGPTVEQWFHAVGEAEALISLAGYAFENPTDPFPEITESGPIYDAAGLGHPLLPRSHCIRNDVKLGDPLQLLVISGSNMSGKSTWLRTVGVNAVLAFAGAPVRAVRMGISPLAIGATLRIQDSLMAGKSRFYAEITRIHRIVETAKGHLPLLFLLDELLHGTNSHDRGIGAAAIVRTLVERGAIGLITTHDLALAPIADNLGAAAANVHFADHLEDGRMTFDYRMRPGVVRHSNAIALMRAVGLPV
jgi:hypothetical protein